MENSYIERPSSLLKRFLQRFSRRKSACISVQAEASIAPLVAGCQIRHMATKRAFDIAFSASVLLAGAPLYLLIIGLIKWSSPGKAIYAHERIGRAGRPFRCYKFRTMYADADQRLAQLLADHPEKRQEWQEKRKLKDDPRILPKIGHFLRKSSLDELPQFWNVLKGDLSIVGPRPIVASEIEQYYQLKAPKILAIRPGLTCLWQVSGRNDTSYATRVLLDEQYVDSQSFISDLILIAKTIPCMLFSKGAY